MSEDFINLNSLNDRACGNSCGCGNNCSHRPCPPRPPHPPCPPCPHPEPPCDPTIEVGTVTTGAPGSQAIVTNTGTDCNAIFNFTIPQGVPGQSVASEALYGYYLTDTATIRNGTKIVLEEETVSPGFLTLSASGRTITLPSGYVYLISYAFVDSSLQFLGIIPVVGGTDDNNNAQYGTAAGAVRSVSAAATFIHAAASNTTLSFKAVMAANESTTALIGSVSITTIATI